MKAGTSHPIVKSWAAIVAVALLFVPTERANSHDWYDGSCCNGSTVDGDCQPIPDSAVKVVPGGYEITLKPGEHRLVTTEHTWRMKTDEVLWSKDENYHACLYPDEATLRCFYAVRMGS